MSEPRTSGLRLLPALLAGLILRRTGLGVAKVRAKIRAKTEAPAETEWDYERSDIAAGRTAWVMLGLAGAVLVTLAAVLGLSHIVLTSQRAALPPLTPQQTRARSGPRPRTCNPIPTRTSPPRSGTRPPASPATPISTRSAPAPAFRSTAPWR